MKKLITIILALLLCGCVMKQPMLLEGKSLKLGCYIPWNGNLYGLELMSFVSGTLVIAQTNEQFSIEHSSSSTNSWMWGMLETVEANHTEIQPK